MTAEPRPGHLPADRNPETKEDRMSAEIKITLPDGAVRDYATGTTGAEVAADISKSLAKSALACPSATWRTCGAT